MRNKRFPLLKIIDSIKTDTGEKIINQNELFNQWRDAADSGSLLVPKHDPNNPTAWSSFRTVLSQEMSGSLKNFIHSTHYTVNHYNDINYQNSIGYFEIIPDPASGFSVIGSQISSGSAVPIGQLDRLIFVFSTREGWHIHAESSQEISGSVAVGRRMLIRTFHS